MTSRISVIIPTVGRGTLRRAIASCVGADEIIVAWDVTVSAGSCPDEISGAKLVVSQGGDHGYTPRTTAIAAATGTHLAFLDDDDVYLPGAIDLMRAHACDRPVVFRMDHYAHGILWREPELRFGNVSTQMFVVPNEPGKLGQWAPHIEGLVEPGGDFTFLAGCVERMGEPVWREEVISMLRPPTGPSIAVVTPFYNHHELIPDYEAAVRELRPGHGDELIVVDNASDPPIGLPGIRLDRNEGFAGASNRGLQKAHADAVLFLNNDVAPLSAGWLEPLREALEPGVLVGARLRSDSHGSVSGQSLPYLDGWCLAGMRDDLLELGGWDETLTEPAYYSDNLLSLRARAVGMTLREVKVPLLHKESITARDNPQRMTAATVANQARFQALAAELLEPVAA